MRLRTGFALALPLLTACGDAAVPDPEKGYAFYFAAGADADAGADLEDAETLLVVAVGERARGCETCPLHDRTDAEVMAGREGALVSLVYDADDRFFEATQVGFGTKYVVRVAIAGVVLEGSFDSPEAFATAVSPDPPSAGQAALVTWSPAGDPLVDALALVTTEAGPTYITPATGSYPDDGEEPLPADALPEPGAYTVLVQRTRAQEIDVGSASVTLTVATSVVAD